MLEFKKITVEDKVAVFGMLKDHTARICDISPANLIFWRDYYDISYAQTEDGYALRFGDMDGISYCADGRDHRARGRRGLFQRTYRGGGARIYREIRVRSDLARA